MAAPGKPKTSVIPSRRRIATAASIARILVMVQASVFWVLPVGVLSV